jgi:hypothetical protein
VHDPAVSLQNVFIASWIGGNLLNFGFYSEVIFSELVSVATV